MQPWQLRKGDRVRITEGRFQGVEAEVVIQPGAGRKEIVVCVDQWMWVPLLHVQPGQYEVIALNTTGKHVYTRLDNDRLFTGLHDAVCRYHTPAGVTDADRALADDVLRQYAELQMDTDILRSKLYWLCARTVLGQRDECRQLLAAVSAFLPLVKAEQSQALLLVTLYGCTDSSIYYDRAHALIDPWRREPQLKKSKQRLLRFLDDYDRVLGHV